MPVYEYLALNKSGKNVKGSLEADSLRAARQKLRGQGMYPTEIKESLKAARSGAAARDVRRIFQSDKVKIGELSIATRQLATLVSAGLPLVAALQALTDQVESVVLKRIITRVRESVQEGESFSKAIGAFPKTFPRLYINLVGAGEASGTLGMVLDNLADYLEAQQELKRKVWSALTYPIIMMLICVLVVIFLLTFVVPQIVEIFKKQGAQLPLPTQITLSLSDFLIHYWFLLLGIVMLAMWLARWYYQQEKGRSRVDAMTLRLPLFGSLYRKINTARITGTLSTLLANGVQLLSALDIVKNIVNNVHMQQALNSAREGVKEGRGFSRELGKSGQFPPMVVHMVAAGEKSGQLEGMLSKVARAYENEVNAAVAALTSLLEPLMMVVMGGVVLSIVLSILLPMTDLIGIMQQP